MRHIPEDELHAYLDQALSRSQCIEIEQHLAGCPACRADRDAIAALRDRTTALLAILAPPRRFKPAFELIEARQAADSARRRHRLQRGAWAASLILALGVGWSGSRLADGVERHDGDPLPPTSAASEVAAMQPRAPSSPVALAPSVPSSRTEPVRTTRREAPNDAGEAGERRTDAAVAVADSPRRAPARSTDSAPIPRRPETDHLAIDPVFQVNTSRLSRTESDLRLDGMWRTMSWDGARAERGDALPRVDGLPVVQVQMQEGGQGQKPLTVVAQQLTSGEVIRTIEGPAADVSTLLARQEAADSASPWPTIDPTGSAHFAESGAMAMQRGDRILAITGHLPSDSLRAMIRRINAETRGRP